MGSLTSEVQEVSSVNKGISIFFFIFLLIILLLEI
nr:MAG TPA: hypothetical protein [Caudoviricetes sp.]